jgi:hypothetical protein
MTLQYLKDITNNFCDEGILGRGGFGVVYKVMLISFLFLIVETIFEKNQLMKTLNREC